MSDAILSEVIDFVKKNLLHNPCFV